MKYILTATIILLLSSCSNFFINHKLQAEKIGECSNEVSPIKVISNINGERFEFDYCLADDYDVKNYTVERKGDSILINFPQPTKKTAQYKLILDIDAKPAYHHILLGDRVVEVVPMQK
jgi:hypothetical protein